MFNVHQEDRFTVVTPDVENLDSSIAAEFRNSFGDVLSEHSDFVLLNLKNVGFMDSSGLAAVVFCFQMTNIKEKLAICDVGERVAKLFKLTNMERSIRIFDTQEAAMAALV